MIERPLIEVTSPTWQSVSAWAQRRIELDTQLCTALGTEPVATECARARIALMRELIGMAAAPMLSTVEADSDGYPTF